MAEETGKKRARIPFGEKLAQIDERIAELRAKVDDLEAKRASMIHAREAQAKAMLAEIQLQQLQVDKGI